MQSRPTPAVLARQYSKAQVPGSTDEVVSALRLGLPRVARLASEFGIDIRRELEQMSPDTDIAIMQKLVSATSTRFELARVIRESLTKQERRLPLLTFLVVEERIQKDASSIAGYFRSAGTSLQDVYLLLAERLGESYLDAAFDVTWKRRAIFTRTLDAARAYLSYVRQAAVLSNTSVQRSIETRLGISTVLSARFGPVTEASLREAQEILYAAHQQGAEYAFTYYLEASNWLYDLFGDDGALTEAVQRLPSETPMDLPRKLAAGHLWLRLAGVTHSKDVREECIKRGLDTLNDSFDLDNERVRKEDLAARTLLVAMFQALLRFEAQGYRHFNTRGILFPFGLRRPDTEMPAIFHLALPDLISALESSDLKNDYVFRDLRAGLHSFLARSTSADKSQAVAALLESIKIREGTPNFTKPLRRPDIEIDLAEDRFLLSRLSGRNDHRRAGIRELIRHAAGNSVSPRHLTLLAREIDESGPLRGPMLDGPDELVMAIRTGDSQALFKVAAAEAYKSSDLTSIPLGGRGGAVTLRDSDGLAGQTFVFKQTSQEAQLRDHAFTAKVRARLERYPDLSQRFGLIEHLTELKPLSSDLSAGEIISVRRYRNGKVLRDYLAFQKPAAVSEMLSDTAEFLAFIHFAGFSSHETNGTRRDIKEREFGCWLKSLIADSAERGQLFDDWWRIVSDAPLLPRRDAHPLNWIVDSSGAIIAVDLETRGTRPFGYELAQLVEDSQFLEPTDWDSRRTIVATYRQHWNGLSDQSVSWKEAIRFYEAGAIARASRAISNPAASTVERAFAGKLLESLASSTGDIEIHNLASHLSLRWRERTGHVGEESLDALSEGDRRRISRAMAHYLRHNKEAPTTKDGWMHVDELADILRSAGHKVTPQQLKLIAGALGEPRFELSGVSEIRAVYGHSTRTEIDYSRRRPPQVLYHATPLQNLASIFEARDGLRKGKRNWVHLTESCAIALNASKRQRSPVAVLEISAGNMETLVHASGVTWLAPSVGVEHLSLLSVRVINELASSHQQPN